MTELQDYEIVMCEPHELSEPLLSKLEKRFQVNDFTNVDTTWH